MLRVDLKCSHHKQEMVCEVMEVLTNPIVVIISQYISETNHIANLKLTQCYMSIIFQ